MLSLTDAVINGRIQQVLEDGTPADLLANVERIWSPTIDARKPDAVWTQTL